MRSQRLLRRSQVLRVNLIEEALLNVGKLVIFVAKQLLPARRQIIFAGRRKPLPDTVVGTIDRAYVAFLALAQLLCRELPSD